MQRTKERITDPQGLQDHHLRTRDNRWAACRSVLVGTGCTTLRVEIRTLVDLHMETHRVIFRTLPHYRERSTKKAHRADIRTLSAQISTHRVPTKLDFRVDLRVVYPFTLGSTGHMARMDRSRTVRHRTGPRLTITTGSTIRLDRRTRLAPRRTRNPDPGSTTLPDPRTRLVPRTTVNSSNPPAPRSL